MAGKQVSVQVAAIRASEHSQSVYCPMVLPQPPMYKTRLLGKPTAATIRATAVCLRSLACMPCRQLPPQQAEAQTHQTGCILGHRVASQQQA